MARKTVLQKSYEAFSQKEGAEPLAKTLEKIHNTLSTQVGKNGDEAIAQRASSVLTKLIFPPKGSSKNIDPLGLSDLTKQLIEEDLKKLREYATAAQNSTKITTEIDKYMSELGKQMAERGNVTERALVKIVNSLIDETFPDNELGFSIVNTGNNQSSVVMKKWVVKLFEKIENSVSQEVEEFIKKNNLIEDNGFIRTHARKGKADSSAQGSYSTKISIAADDTSLQADIRAVAQVFGSASIKSSNDISRIHLEDVDIKKAYGAFIQLSHLNNSQFKKTSEILLSGYYGIGGKSCWTDDAYITLHINHLLSAYGLAGFGTSQITDLNSISTGVDYLVVVDNKNRRILVHSTKEIINRILLKSIKQKKLRTSIDLSLRSLDHLKT